MKRKTFVALMMVMTLSMSLLTGCNKGVDSDVKETVGTAGNVESNDAKEDEGTASTEVEGTASTEDEGTASTEDETEVEDTESREDETTVTEEITDEIVEITVAQCLLNTFYAEASDGADIEDIAAKILEDDCISMISTVTDTVEPGYLAGFDEEVKGFSKGVSFGPVIGTLPFVGYIFETDTPDVLVDGLNNTVNLNWNICTSADEVAITSLDNYVFVVLAPYSFDN